MGLFSPLVLLVDLLVAAGVGYWCMTIFRRKGRSPRGGFVLGFLLTLFLSLLGAAIALVISYVQRSA